MDYEIIWAGHAKRSLQNILSYLESQFTEKEIHNFVVALYEKLEFMLNH